MDSKKFYGTHTALVTPFKKEAVHFDDLANLIEFQIANKVQGVVALGTTAETPTLTPEEREQVAPFVIRQVKGRIPVIVGTGSACTTSAVKKAQLAEKWGADAILVVTPYYNKPSQEGLFLHFSEIAKATRKPIILYSIPGRCNIEISIEILKRLRDHYDHIIGIKEAGGACNRVTQMAKEMDSNFVILSGDDALTLPFIASGAKGVISVASNLIPAEVVAMVNAALANDLETAAELNRNLYPLFKALFLETNPVPIKHALFKKQKISNNSVRLPLCDMQPSNTKALEKVLQLF
ncbi:MAG: 4-hydroxy-tetrahydrodipicolinate synthase [Verrucomicrobia bacterium GWF2_51_19]|nr:MAG: 4-hydroxy-tetrahydrodipicolinate synthase [Verrucomicrobia bacterium GWF2_51_19]HCJ12236.1 4-hydroxy-tetrahydrodipicolinate synthase [Opitutae bacterium]